MKKQLPLLLAAALLAACGSSAEVKRELVLLPEPKPALPQGMSYHYEPADKDFCSQLHDACRRCAAIEFSYGSQRPEDIVRVTREEAAPALEAILGIHNWQACYVLVDGRKQPRKSGGVPAIRFLDEAGKDILALRDYPSGPGYAPKQNGAGPISLWNLFSVHLRRAQSPTN